jgi:hypothetical protein
MGTQGRSRWLFKPLVFSKCRFIGSLGAFWGMPVPAKTEFGDSL